MKRNRQCEEATAAALYALGALPSPEARQFEQRLASGCPVCRSEYAAFADVADHLAASPPPCAPPPQLRQRLLDRIGAPSKTEPNGSVPDMVLVRAQDSPWVPLPVPGIEVRPLLGKKTLLVRMQPGSAFPAHAHEQVEQCYVLEGSVTDSDGITAYAGDFICMPAGITHEPIRTETGCTFLIAYSA